MASRIITSRHVFDGTHDRSYPAAVVIEGDIISAVVPPQEMDAYIAKDTLVEDFEDAFICAGLHDAHQHVFHSALYPSARAMEYCGASEADCAQHMYDFAKDQPYGSWALSHGWRDMLWDPAIPPTRLSLDALFPNRPVAMYSGDSHTLWLNTCGLKRLGIDENTQPPAGGSFDRDEEGRLTGVLREGAGMYYIARVLESLSKEELRQIFLDWTHELNRRGITSVDDMGLSAIPGCDAVLDEVWRDLEASGELTVRGHLFPTLPLDGDLDRIEKLQAELTGPMLRAPGVKQFFDGVSSAHTAWLLEPYENPRFPDDHGHPAIPPAQMRDIVLGAAKEGIAVRIHTIGDAAVHEGVSIFEEAADKYGQPHQGRFCLEHIENLERDDVDRMAAAKIVASVQPQHVVIDITQPARDLGEERASFMWPFKTYLKSGVDMAFGTDSPCVPCDPAAILADAVTRQDASGAPMGGWLPEERVTAAEALRAVTLGSAVAVGRQDELGTLEPGKFADLIVIDKNPLSCPPQELHQAQVLACYVGGNKVYETA